MVRICQGGAGWQSLAWESMVKIIRMPFHAVCILLSFLNSVEEVLEFIPPPLDLSSKKDGRRWKNMKLLTKKDEQREDGNLYKT